MKQRICYSVLQVWLELDLAKLKARGGKNSYLGGVLRVMEVGRERERKPQVCSFISSRMDGCREGGEGMI